MKKNLIVLFFMCLSGALQAQYSMTTTTTTYQELSNPISLNNGTLWDEGSNYPVVFNFNFVINGQTYTKVNVKAGGGINFPGSGFKELQVFFTPFGGYLLRDIGVGTSASDISYEISGASGNQILKVQWTDAHLGYGYSTSSPSDYVDFQVWLFEADSHMEIHYGSSSTTPGTYGYPNSTSISNPGPCINFDYDQCSSVFNIFGPADLPSYMFYNLCSPNYSFLEGTPSIGTTYNIFPSVATAVTEARSNALLVFPNPAKDNLQVSNLPANVKALSVVSLTGQTYETSYSYLTATDVQLSLSNVPDGVYFLRVTTETEQILYQKFMKRNL